MLVSPTAAMLEPNFAQDLQSGQQSCHRICHNSHQHFSHICPSPESLGQLGGSRVCRLSRVEQGPQVLLAHVVHLHDGDHGDCGDGAGGAAG